MEAPGTKVLVGVLGELACVSGKVTRVVGPVKGVKEELLAVMEDLIRVVGLGIGVVEEPAAVTGRAVDIDRGLIAMTGLLVRVIGDPAGVVLISSCVLVSLPRGQLAP